jgi:ABC-type branched-subunit amino acid transport system ATPase component
MKQFGSQGLILYEKSPEQKIVLKEMLQFVRTQTPGKGIQFALVEDSVSLIPQLSLWENLSMLSGYQNWWEFCTTLQGEWQSLAKLIQNPDLKGRDAAPWEKLTVGLLKALMTNSQLIMVEINEQLHSPFVLNLVKKLIHDLAQNKHVILAGAEIDLWKDQAWWLVRKDGYTFIIENIDSNRKSSRAA